MFLNTNNHIHQGLSSETKVRLTNGKAYPIREIVKKHIQGNVYVLDHTDNSIREQPIIGWHEYGLERDRDYWKHITTTGYGKSNFIGVSATNSLPIFTNLNTEQQGWVHASDLKPDKDKLVTSVLSVINSRLKDFLWGLIATGNNTVRPFNQHSAELYIDLTLITERQRQYADWIKQLLHPLLPELKFSTGKVNLYDPVCDRNRFVKSMRISGYHTHELQLILNQIKEAGGTMNAFFKYHFSDLGFAVWFMYRGIIRRDGIYYPLPELRSATGKVDKTRLEEAAAIFEEKTRLETYPDLDSCGLYWFNHSSTVRYLNSLIYHYTPDFIANNLLDYQYRSYYNLGQLTNKPCQIPAAVNILNLRSASNKQLHNMHVYNLSVANSDNYFAGSKQNGMIVHSDIPVSDINSDENSDKNNTEVGITASDINSDKKIELQAAK